MAAKNTKPVFDSNQDDPFTHHAKVMKAIAARRKEAANNTKGPKARGTVQPGTLEAAVDKTIMAMPFLDVWALFDDPTWDEQEWEHTYTLAKNMNLHFLDNPEFAHLSNRHYAIACLLTILLAARSELA